jgi:hypothetical protein
MTGKFNLSDGQFLLGIIFLMVAIDVGSQGMKLLELLALWRK